MLYPGFLPPEVASVNKAVILRQRLARTTLLENGYKFAERHAVWIDEDAKLELEDPYGKKLRLSERGVRDCYDRWRQGKDAFNGNLDFHLAFIRWIDKDMRRAVYPSLTFGDKVLPDDLKEGLSDSHEVFIQGRQQIVELFDLKVDQQKPEKNDVFAEKVLDVLFGS